MASYVDELRKLQGALRVKIRDYVNSNLLDASHKEAYGIAILVLVLVVSPVIIILVHNAVATIQVWHSQSLRTLQLEFYLQYISKSVTSVSRMTLNFRHRASCVLGQAFRYSPENAFYIFNQQIYFII